jgi:hypothetical protein
MAPNSRLWLPVIVSLSVFTNAVKCSSPEAPAHSPFDSKNVVVLTDETFDKTVKDYQYVLV